jgi:ATP synthase F0 subunit c
MMAIMELSSWIEIASVLGAGCAMGFGAIGSAIGEGYAAASANEAISRQPNQAGEIVKMMLLGQAIAESAAIFALLISMILLFSKPTLDPGPMEAIVLLSSGLCMGLGAIGSGVGSGFPAGSASMGIARQPGARKEITNVMLIGSAIAQTPSIFALVISLILLFMDFSARAFSPSWAAFLGAGLSAGIGAIGSGIGEGLVAQSGCEGVARQPIATGRVRNVMLLGMAVSETTAIYGLLIAMILIFKTFPESTTLSSAMALLGAGICMGIGAIGPGIGEGFTAQKDVIWVGRNEAVTPTLTRSMLVGQAVAESTGIYAMVIALIMIFVF